MGPFVGARRSSTPRVARGSGLLSETTAVRIADTRPDRHCFPNSACDANARPHADTCDGSAAFNLHACGMGRFCEGIQTPLCDPAARAWAWLCSFLCNFPLPLQQSVLPGELDHQNRRKDIK